MRHAMVNEFGGPDVVQIEETPDPVPPRDGYVVQMKAASLNYADVVERRGLYKRDQQAPMVLGKEGAGVVVDKGPAATEFEIGDPVCVGSIYNGCFAEYKACHPWEVLRPPAGMSFVEMGAFVQAFVTGYFAMHEIARVRAGETALIQAAAGGVGTSTVKLAKVFGLSPVIGTAGSPEKCELARERGADVCVNYREEDFHEVVMDITNGRGVDFCLESVGGDVYNRSLKSLAPLGRMVIIGFTSIFEDYSQEIKRLHPLTVFQRSISVSGLHIDNLDWLRNFKDRVGEGLVATAEEHMLRPHIGLRFAFENIQDAYAALESRQSTGKVVLEITPDCNERVIDLRSTSGDRVDEREPQIANTT